MSPSSARFLDQFYTQRSLAERLTAEVRRVLEDADMAPRWLEPSAGDGAFLDYFPSGSLALDIDPRHPRVRAMDFLTWSPQHEPGASSSWAVVGNPPFGKNSSLAVKFFNHAATFADTIAFIVPRTFEKASLQTRLHLHFWLVFEEVLPEDSFVFEGSPCAVPCVFQIWQRRPEARAKTKKALTHPDFAFVDKASADFAFQRVGAAAGKIKDLNAPHLAAPSHYFIRATLPARAAAVRGCLANIDWSDVKHRTAGNPSISKAELVALYAQALP